MPSDYADYMHGQDMEALSDLLMYSFGNFFVRYNQLEQTVTQVLMDFYEIPTEKQSTFRRGFFRLFRNEWGLASLLN